MAEKKPATLFAAGMAGKEKQPVSDRVCTRENQAVFAKFLLTAIRTAILRCKLDANELQSIGTALANGWITPEGAVAWLSDIGLADALIGGEVKAQFQHQ